MRGTRRFRFVLLLLVLVSLTLTVLDYQAKGTGPTGALRRGVDTIFGPVLSGVGGAGRSVGGVLHVGSSSSDSALRQENARLQARLAQLSGVACEQQQLGTLLHLTDYLQLTSVPARVVSRSAGFGFEKVVTIDAGSRDGLAAEMPVIAAGGLVGRTTQVGASTSTVLLLTDPDFGVGGSLPSVSAFGTVSGTGASTLSMALEATQAAVKHGAVVLTTGSSTYPAGIPVGTVQTVQPGTGGTSRTAVVRPAVDPGALDLVEVITQPQRTAPRVPEAPTPAPTSSCARS